MISRVAMKYLPSALIKACTWEVSPIFTRVLTFGSVPDGMVKDPQFVARDAIHWEEHESLGRVPMPNVFPKLSETPGAVRRAAPDTVGQHSAEVLGEVLGLDAGECEQLRRAGII